MNTFAKISTAALIASSLVFPLATATQAASVHTGAAFSALNAVSADRFIDIIGQGAAEVDALTSGAQTVNVIRIGDVYTGNIHQDVDDALEEGKRFSVQGLRTQIASNPSAQAWFDANGVNAKSVLSIDSSKGRINVYVAG